MKWAHLPVAGGLYDQDPEFLDGVEQIFSARNEHEAKEAKKKEAEHKRNSPSKNKPPRGGRRGR